jgi:hypothetical protein
MNHTTVLFTVSLLSIMSIAAPARESGPLDRKFISTNMTGHSIKQAGAREVQFLKNPAQVAGFVLAVTF